MEVDISKLNLQSNSPMDYLEALLSQKIKNLSGLIKTDGLSQVNRARYQGNGLVHVAAASSNPELAQLVTQAGLDLEERNDEGMTAVHVAVAGGRAEALDIFLQSGADPNVTYGRAGWGPMHLAVRSNTASVSVQLDILRMLLKSGANANLADADGNTPLHLAVEVSADKRLVAQLADAVNNRVSVRNLRHLTPLEYAAINGNRRAIQQLVKRGAVPQIRLLNRSGYITYVEVFLEITINKLSTDSVGSLLRNPDFQSLINYIVSYKLNETNRLNAQGGQSTMVSDLTHSRYSGLGTFKSLLMNNVNTQFANYLVENVKAKAAWADLVVTYILYRESASLLKILIEDRLLFFLTDATIRGQLVDIYKGKFNRYLPSSLIQSFMAADGATKLQIERRLHHWLKKKSGICLAKFKFPSAEVLSIGTTQVFREPAFSLITWSTSSGRYHLLPYLFLAEDTDNIALGLFNMALLNRLAKARNSVGTLFSQDAEYYRLELEVLIHHLISRMWHLDKSYEKVDSALFLLLQLPMYGTASMLDMAMQARSMKLLQFSSSIGAMRLLWYRGLAWMSSWHRFLLTASSLGLWFILLIPILVPLLDRLTPAQSQGYQYLRRGLLLSLAFINLLIGIWLAGIYTRRRIQQFRQGASVAEKEQPRKFGNILLTGAPGQQWQFSALTAETPGSSSVSAFLEFLRTPAVKYISFLLTYAVYLLLGIFIAMQSFRYVITDAEIVYWIFFFGFLLESGQQFVRAKLFGSCFSRQSVFWTIVSVLTYLLGLVAFISRMVYHTAHQYENRMAPAFEAQEVADTTFLAVRYLFVLSHALMFLQIWRFLTPRPCIGLLIRMIEQLIKYYLCQFLLLMSLVLVRGAFIFGSILYPQGYAMHAGNGTVIKLPAPAYVTRVFVHSYYSVMGEFLSDYLSGFECQGGAICPATYLGSFLVTVFHMSGYAFYTTLLLLGLLISLVTIIVDELNRHHIAHWQIARYKFMHELNYYSLIYPPFNLPVIVAEWVAIVISRREVAQLYDLNHGFYSQSALINNLLSQTYVLERDRDRMLSEIEQRREHRNRTKIDTESGLQKWDCSF